MALLKFSWGIYIYIFII